MKKNTKIIAWLIVILGILSIAGYVLYRQPKGTKDKQALDGKTIVISEDGFTPESLTVRRGTTVKFMNSDTYWHWPASDPHPSHTFYSELDPKEPIKPGTTWEVTLNNAGKWGIHDHLAPYIVGTIIVTE